MTKILFVCMGNLCRSPAAEAILNKLIEKHDLKDRLSCASAGTSANHVGKPHDPRMCSLAEQRGYPISGKAKQVRPEDFDLYDYIVPMDKSNQEFLVKLAPNESDRKKIVLMTRFSLAYDDADVPDPFYGDESDFEEVVDILEDACTGLLLQLRLVTMDDD